MSDTDRPFKDHFSGHAADYAVARPGYPDELFAALARLCPSRDRAWDCATGSGQAANALAEHFTTVVATDASAEQLAQAGAHRKVRYHVATAEDPAIEAGSVDLITVAQALHWFDVDRFFATAKNVLRPGGVLAYWCYGFCAIEPACDAIVRAMYDRLEAFWPPERAIVEAGYRDIAPPFASLPLATFRMQESWTGGQMLRYVHTWSAYQRAKRGRAESPLADLEANLIERWGGSRRARGLAAVRNGVSPALRPTREIVPTAYFCENRERLTRIGLPSVRF